MKTVIVTGASGNMGKAVVEKFLHEEYRVIGTVTLNDLAPAGTDHMNFEKIIVDLANEDDSGTFIRSVIEKYQAIDVVVLTVGGFVTGSIAETKTADLFNQYRLNFETAYNIARPVFIQMMKQNYGRIFLTGSRPGLDTRDGKGLVAYGMSKSLLFRLAELMNDEAKGRNLVTAVLVPGTIDTPQNRKAMPDMDSGGWVKAEAIADTIYSYCREEVMAVREPVIKLYNNS